jgi:hypothetical protein
MLELGKAIALMASIVSLYPAMFSAFFVPGTGWQERLFLCGDKVVLSGCVCLASGMLFTWPSPEEHWEGGAGVLRTLPMRLYFCALAGMAVLFAVSWYLAVYYSPLTYKYQPW